MNIIFFSKQFKEEFEVSFSICDIKQSLRLLIEFGKFGVKSAHKWVATNLDIHLVNLDLRTGRLKNRL